MFIIGSAAIAILKKYLISKALDEEGRENIFLIFASIFVAIFLIITAIIYIISSPFSAIKDYFSIGEQVELEKFLNDYGYVQLVDDSGEDYIYSSEYDFSDFSFEDSVIDVTYYNQADSRWKDFSYGYSDKIGTHGCGPTSLAIVISTLTNKNENPVSMSKWAFENGYCAVGAGSDHQLIPDGAKAFGLNVEGATNDEAEKIVKALTEGKLIIAIMGRGHFTTSGHFLVLRGVTSEGKILVADPISVKKSQQEWDLNIFLNEAKRGAAAGGPFWIISN